VNQSEYLTSIGTCQILADCVGCNTQFLDREIQAIHPEGRVAKQLVAGSIPAAKRGENNFFPP